MVAGDASGLEFLKGGGAVEHRAEVSASPPGGLPVDDGVAAEQNLVGFQPQGGEGGQKPLRVRLGGGNLVAAQNGGQQGSNAPGLRYVADGGFLVLTMPVGIPRRFRAVSSSSAPGNSRVTDTCMGPAFSV